METVKGSYFLKRTVLAFSTFLASIPKNIIALEFNGSKIGGKVVAANKAMLGHLFLISLGVYDKDVLLKHLQKNDEIRIQLVDGNNIIASKYFDVLVNEWSIKGIKGAFSKAYDDCKKASL